MMNASIPSLVLSALLVSSALSQEAPDKKASDIRAASEVTADAEIASWMIGEYKKEIEIARIGKQNATSDMVRQFADQLIKHHELALSKFSQWAIDVAPSDSQLVVSDNSRAPNLTWLNINSEIQERVLSSTKASLASRVDSDFDKEFLEVQMRYHQAKKEIDHILAQFASPACRSKLEECFELDATHLKQAKRIHARLESSEGLQTAKR